MPYILHQTKNDIFKIIESCRVRKEAILLLLLSEIVMKLTVR